MKLLAATGITLLVGIGRSDIFSDGQDSRAYPITKNQLAKNQIEIMVAISTFALAKQSALT